MSEVIYSSVRNSIQSSHIYNHTKGRVYRMRGREPTYEEILSENDELRAIEEKITETLFQILEGAEMNIAEVQMCSNLLLSMTSRETQNETSAINIIREQELLGNMFEEMGNIIHTQSMNDDEFNSMLEKNIQIILQNIPTTETTRKLLLG